MFKVHLRYVLDVYMIILHKTTTSTITIVITQIGKKIESICVKNNIDYITELGGECPCVVFDVFSNAIYDRIV